MFGLDPTLVFKYFFVDDVFIIIVVVVNIFFKKEVETVLMNGQIKSKCRVTIFRNTDQFYFIQTNNRYCNNCFLVLEDCL